MTLTIVYDTDYECTAIYIGGILRAEFGEGKFDSKELMDCYESFAFGEPVKLERMEIASSKLGIDDDLFALADWPETLEKLKELSA